jgi:hypothetical protein
MLRAPSLLSEGIAARLGQHLDQLDLEVVDTSDAEGVARAVASRPQVVLFEARDTHIESPCPLSELLAAASPVRLIRLDADHDQIQLVTSEVRDVSRPGELLSLVLGSP